MNADEVLAAAGLSHAHGEGARLLAIRTLARSRPAPSVRATAIEALDEALGGAQEKIVALYELQADVPEEVQALLVPLRNARSALQREQRTRARSARSATQKKSKRGQPKDDATRIFLLALETIVPRGVSVPLVAAALDYKDRTAPRTVTIDGKAVSYRDIARAGGLHIPGETFMKQHSWTKTKARMAQAYRELYKRRPSAE